MFTTETRQFLKTSSIFVIDDNSILYDFIKKTMHSKSHLHFIFKDKTKVTKDDVLEHKPHIVLFHVDNSNIEFLNEIKSDLELKEIPILCFLKDNDSYLIKMCFQYGCSDCCLDFCLNADIMLERIIFHIGMTKLFQDKQKTINELEELRTELAEMQKIVDRSPIVAFVCVLNNGEFEVVYASKGVEVFGYEPEQFYDKSVSWVSMIYELDKARVVNHLMEAIKNGKKELVQEYRIHTKTGLKWTEARVMIERDYKGEVSHVKGLLIDITDRKDLESEILRQQNMLYAVLDAMPCNIFWKNRHFVYEGCNTKEADALGLSNPDDIIGKTDFDLDFTKENAEYFRKIDEDVMKTSLSRVGVIDQIIRKNGTFRWVETNKVPLFDDKCNVIGIVGAYTDITEKKKMEEYNEQVRKMDAIAKLTSGLVHDFKNMLMLVSGYMQLLELEKDEAKKQTYFDKIKKNLEASENLLTKIMGFSKEEKDVEMVEVDIDEFIKTNVYDLFEGTIKQKIILDLGSEAKIKINQSVFIQMMVNLIINANKAVESREKGEIAIRTRKSDCLEISVVDNGTGIDKSLLGKMFEPFVTTDGTGLGLFIVWEAVKLHKGKIFCDSDENKGTVFYIVLPIE